MDSVYVVEGKDAVKVGVARDPLRRLKQLQTGSSHPLRLAWSTQIIGDAYRVEAEAHAFLSRHRTQGEWFAVPADVAVAAVSGAAYRTMGDGNTFKAPWPLSLCIAACFAPAWAGMTLVGPVIGFPLLFAALIGQAVVLRRRQARGRLQPLETALGVFGGIGLSVPIGLIIGLIGSPTRAHADDLAEGQRAVVITNAVGCTTVGDGVLTNFVYGNPPVPIAVGEALRARVNCRGLSPGRTGSILLSSDSDYVCFGVDNPPPDVPKCSWVLKNSLATLKPDAPSLNK